MLCFFFSNPTIPICTHGRCSIFPTANGRKTDWKCCQCSEWLCKDHSIETIHIKCDNCNHTRDKFHSHLCSKLYFVVLKHFKCFIPYNCMKNEKSNKCNVLTSIEPINWTIETNEKIILKNMGTIITQFHKSTKYFSP